MLEHKGYSGRIEFSEGANAFHGEVAGIRDVVTCQASSVEQLHQAFQDSVEDYLAFCEERGEQPEITH